MAVLRTNDVRPAIGILEEINITLGTTKLVDLPQPYPIAPTNLPNPGQFSFTITADMYPTMDMDCTYILIPYIYAYGRNVSGSSGTVSYTMTKNGTAQQSGAGTIGNNNNFCTSVLMNTGVALGDVFDMRIWSTVTGVEIYGGQIILVPSRIFPKHIPVNSPIRDIIMQNIPVPRTVPATGTAFSVGWTGSWYMPAFNSIGFSKAAGSYAMPVYFINPTYGLGALQGGDVSNPTQATTAHSTLYGGVNTCVYPTKMSFRRIYL